MYQNLSDIKAEKEKLHKAISDKENEINNLWDTLFHPKEEHLIETPTQRLLHYANTGAGLLDGAILGWKLYRKIGGTFSFRSKRRRR